MTFMNVLGHLGFELYPKGFTTHWLGKWNNTSTHHNMHHKYYNCNYGLYFNIWDRIMGTNHSLPFQGNRPEIPLTSVNEPPLLYR